MQHRSRTGFIGYVNGPPMMADVVHDDRAQPSRPAPEPPAPPPPDTRGDAMIGPLLDAFCSSRGWHRLRGRRPAWRVLHAADEAGVDRARGGIDHLLIGPPGVVAVKGHRGGRVDCGGDDFTVDGRPTDRIRDVISEAAQVRELLAAALRNRDVEPAVRPMIVVVHGRVTRTSTPRVLVVRGAEAAHFLSSLNHRFTPDQVDALHAAARGAPGWTELTGR